MLTITFRTCRTTAARSDFVSPPQYRARKGPRHSNANAYREGLSNAAKRFLFPLWKERNEKTLAAFRGLIRLEGTKFQYLAGAREPQAVSPDAWTHDQALLDRSGSVDRQLPLFVDYEKNLALYEEDARVIARLIKQSFAG